MNSVGQKKTTTSLVSKYTIYLPKKYTLSFALRTTRRPFSTVLINILSVDENQKFYLSILSEERVWCEL